MITGGEPSRVDGEHVESPASVPESIACSACILGITCRYDSKALKGGDQLLDHLKSASIMLVCPELLGGLPLPRPPSEICGGDGDDVLDGNALVKTIHGDDVTAQFIAGAKRALAALPPGTKRAVLCDKSPACGVTTIFDGSFSGQKKSGCGVFTALLLRNGIEVEAWTPDPDKL